ncbi:hypothetical protein ACFT5C_07400 [Streptomyces sp. NPDC057116]|uniref:hypothetical protein n=1 Tax=Streptomyces sp. NPDC057116 TaxID=3346023 RepID=UPI003633159C
MKGKRKRLDLNTAQVAGSAVAAVVAAKLASKMGVYGTVLGAGVISVIATCGGSVFQHLFRSTGERVRGVTAQAARPRARRPGRPRVPSVAGDPRARPPLGPTTGLAAGPGSAAGDGFGEATTYGTRVRGWRRSAVAAALVFGVAMAGITAYELISGEDFSGGKGTTISTVVRGGDDSAPHRPPTPSTDPPSTSGPHREDRPHGERSPGPDRGRDGTPTPTPVPTPDPTPPPTPTPTPPPTPTPTPTPPPAPTPSPDGSAE